MGMTMADVQKHSSGSSCWTAVNGGVYDLTSFTSKHPGGSNAILSLCGIDGTPAFVDQHGNQRRPNNELAGLKIGDLAK
jgi:cytochrome b involved in lipid metabolism